MALLCLPRMESLSMLGAAIPDIVMLSLMHVTKSLTFDLNCTGSRIPIDMWGGTALCTSLHCNDILYAHIDTLMYFDSTRTHWDTETQQLISDAFSHRAMEIEQSIEQHIYFDEEGNPIINLD